MALTNYRGYRWLINLLEDCPDQKFGMTVEQIDIEYNRQYRKIYNLDIDTSARVREGITKEKKIFTKENTERATFTYKNLINWRNAIWKEFGLIIWHPVVKGKVNGVEKEIAKKSYILVNRELLDEGKTLRETLDHLVEDEQRGYVSESPFKSTTRGRTAKAKTTTGDTMGFVSVGDNSVDYYEPQFGYQEEPEMVDTIRFLITIGEALVIRKNSKNMVLEAQALKCINDRWYVLGNVYDYGDRETLKPVIYDVLDLQISEDEDVVGPLYEVMDDYDIYKLIPDDWSEHFDPDKVVSIYFKVAGRLFEDTPFCQTQEKININVGLLHNVYRVFVKTDKDFYLQYMAYGDNVRVYYHFDKIERTPIDISDDQIVYLKSLRQRYL